MTEYAWNEVQTARTFALIGFIFFAIVAAGLALATLITLIALSALFTIAGVTIPFFFPFVFPFGVFLPLSIGLTIWSWIVLKDVDAGRYVQAQNPSLILGILGLFVNVISGIFFLLAYMKLGSAIQYAETPPPSFRDTSFGTGRYCMECGRAVTLDAKYCHHCGKALA